MPHNAILHQQPSMKIFGVSIKQQLGMLFNLDNLIWCPLHGEKLVLSRFEGFFFGFEAILGHEGGTRLSQVVDQNKAIVIRFQMIKKISSNKYKINYETYNRGKGFQLFARKITPPCTYLLLSIHYLVSYTVIICLYLPICASEVQG